MIPQLALLTWMVVAVGMFATMRPLRAFLLTYVVGYLFLPVEVGNGISFIGSIYISQAIRIDKLTACNIGALVGTFVFAPDVVKRFRLHWVDAVYGALLVGAFLTSMVNGLGAKDGLSHAVEALRRFLPLMVLARMYLTGPGELLEALRAILGGAFVYAFLCVGEWRFSPQLHRLVYGYFQHSFDQFIRYSHFRPAVFLTHAIEVSFFMGTSAAAALWLWAKGLFPPLWGVVPAWIVAGALLAGTAATMTYSGFGAFLGCAAIFGLMAWTGGCGARGSRWSLLVLPAIAVLWMAGRYTGAVDASLLMRTANSMDPDRAESLAYRLDSERLHMQRVSQNLWLGQGAMNGVIRSEDGLEMKAVDAYWLITLIFYGLVGLLGWYLVWGAGLIVTVARWGELTRDARAVLAAVAVMVGAQYVDFLFNAFPSPFLLMLSMGAVAVLQHYRETAQRESLRTLWLAQLAVDADTGGMMAMEGGDG